MKTRNTILIVDDMEVNRAILCSLFEEEYTLLEAEDGVQALELLEKQGDSIAVMLLDIVMPKMDGYRVLQAMAERKYLTNVPVVVITSEASAESELQAFDYGASDIVTKPFEPHLVRRRVMNIIELYRHKLNLEDMVEEQAEQLRESNEVLTDALSSVIEYRSLESGQHIRRIRMFTKILMQNVSDTYQEYHMEPQTIDVIARASSMHDIGKIAIPDSILNKPGKLTQEEFEIMKTHTIKGCEILEGLEKMNDKEYLQYAYYICRYHHERWDGRGYPDQLQEDEIPVYAQVVGIADCYDALTTNRVYKAAFSPEKAASMVLGGECGTFSPKLLKCFQNVQGEFAHLARDYADGLVPVPSSAESEEHPRGSLAPLQAPLGQGKRWQMKFYAMLRYMKATVLDINMHTGRFEMIHAPAADFDALRAKVFCKETLERFAQESVHPDDRARMIQNMTDYQKRFQNKNVRTEVEDYRIFNKSTNTYRRYRAALINIDTETLNHDEVLLVWTDMEEEKKQQPGYCGKKDCQERQEKKEKVLEVLTENLDQLANHLPCGLFRCTYEEPMTFLQVNEGFLKMLGCTREELGSLYHNCLWEVMDPRDRDAIHSQAREQVRLGQPHQLEYRITRRDGSALWVMDFGQLTQLEDVRNCFCSVLVDISGSQKDKEELRLTLERYQIVLNQTNDIVFEWDILDDSFNFTQSWEIKFGYVPMSKNVTKRIKEDSHIHPEDQQAFLEMLLTIRRGEPYVEKEIRMKTTEVSYLWCRIRMTAQYNEKGEAVKAVGVFIDIDQEKRETQDLIEKAQRDTLTRLYNKGTSQRMIEKYLEQRLPDRKAAVLIIDIDDFKKVNDTRGHLFGDALLVEISQIIRKQFRANDIVGRIGGDEFMVCIRDIPGLKMAEEKAKQILEEFSKAALVEDMDGISCSIGLALWPDDGESFQALYRKADFALYQAKKMGKDQYVVYNEEARQENLEWVPQKECSEVNATIDSDEEGKSVHSQMVEHIFRALYKSVDVEMAVESILKLVGRQFDVSRSYIFENNEDNTCCRNTFEWCSDGVKAEKEALQNVSYEKEFGGHYLENFNEEGVFYCQDISILSEKQCAFMKAQNVKAVLQCAIYDRGIFRGYVGFDECRSNRYWTREQIEALSFIAEILSVFLLKKRAQDQQYQFAEAMQTILDNQNSWIYVIDPDTRELLFINQKTMDVVPGIKTGMRCCQAFFGMTEVCGNCPASKLREGCENWTERMFVPSLGSWAYADASMITWEGKKAYLMCCHECIKYDENNGRNQKASSEENSRGKEENNQGKEAGLTGADLK